MTSHITRIAELLGTNPESAKGFVKNVNEQLDHSVSAADIANALLKLERDDRTIDGVADYVREPGNSMVHYAGQDNLKWPKNGAVQLVGGGDSVDAGAPDSEESAARTEEEAAAAYLQEVTPLIRLAEELVIDPREAAAFCYRIERVLGYQVTSSEVLETVQKLELDDRDEEHVVAAIELSRIGEGLGLAPPDAKILAKQLEEHLSIVADNHTLLRALNVGKGETKPLSQLVWLLKLGQLLETEPEGARQFQERVASALDRTIVDEELLKAIMDLGDRYYETDDVVWQLRINRIRNVVGQMDAVLARQLLQAIDELLPSRARSIEIAEILERSGEDKMIVDELAERIMFGRISDRLADSFAAAQEYVQAVGEAAGQHYRPRLILEALTLFEGVPGRGDVTPDPAEIAALLEIAGRKKLDVYAALLFARDVQANCQSDAPLTEISRALRALRKSQPTTETVAAYVDINHVLTQVQPGQSPSDVRTWLQEEMGYPLYYAQLRDRLEGVNSDSLLNPGSTESIKAFRSALKLACELDSNMGAVARLLSEAARKSGRPLSLDFLTQAMPSASTENRQLPRAVDYVSLALLFNVSGADLFKLDSVLTTLYSDRQQVRIFWQQVGKAGTQRKLRMEDLDHLQLVSELPGAGLRWLQPDGDETRWIAKSDVEQINRRLDSGLNKPTSRFRSNYGAMYDQRVERVRSYIANCWEEIRSSRRLYKVSSEGRIEIEVAPQQGDLLDLQALRFVSEGVLAPAVYVQLSFGNNVGVVKLDPEGQSLGFHLMSEDELFKSFIDALTVSYYRDLVVPRDKHTGRLSDLSRLKRESAGRWRAERKMPSPRRRGKSVWRRRAMYSLEDWYDAQERARYYVKGNSPRVADNFDGGTVELAQALVSGIIVKRGDTWVYEQGDSKSKHFGALALQGLDLARRTFFKPPVRATAELDELMADIYWYD